jgi:trimeric autotransporter adhesin
VGYKSLYANTTASNNTAVGYDALTANTTGTKNVCIGFGAGDAITTGSNNTIIGDFAGTTTLADTIVLASGTTERLRINSSGNLLVGSKTSTYQAVCM